MSNMNNQNDPHELFANEFALALLMPEDIFLHYVYRGWDAGQLSNKFKVTEAHVLQRVKGLSEDGKVDYNMFIRCEYGRA